MKVSRNTFTYSLLWLYMDVSGQFYSLSTFIPNGKVSVFMGYEAGWATELVWSLWKRHVALVIAKFGQRLLASTASSRGVIQTKLSLLRAKKKKSRLKVTTLSLSNSFPLCCRSTQIFNSNTIHNLHYNMAASLGLIFKPLSGLHILLWSLSKNKMVFYYLTGGNIFY